MAVRILLADDSSFWREQIRGILEQEPGLTVFQAADGAEALRKSMWIRPDLIILDVCMPVLDGLSAAREFRRVLPGIPVLIVTVDKDTFLEAKARDAGVVAVFSKMECLEVCKFVKRRFVAKAA